MSTEIRAIIVDDEPLARRRLRRLCDRAGDVAVIAEAGDGVEAIAQIERHRPELLFLDVQLPEPSGFGILEALGGDRPPLVVFVTAHGQHAVDAFAVDALDYLLKPFDSDRFQETMARVRERMSAAREPSASPRRAERFPVRSGSRIRFVDVGDIDYVAAEANYVTLHAGARSFLVRETMNAMEASLDPASFVRIHRSIIVRVDRVEEMEALASGEYILRLRGGSTVTSARSYRHKLLRALRLDP